MIEHAWLLAIGSPAAILLAAGVAWRSQHKIAQKKATLDFISKHEINNREWQESVRLFRKLTTGPNHPEPLMTLLSPTNAQEENRLMISRMLNYYEAVAVAIEQGVISEEIYAKWNRTLYVETWTKAKSYIQARRDRAGQDTAQENFQNVAERWIQESVEQN